MRVRVYVDVCMRVCPCETNLFLSLALALLHGGDVAERTEAGCRMVSA